jgi:hypothetical protein
MRMFENERNRASFRGNRVHSGAVTKNNCLAVRAKACSLELPLWFCDKHRRSSLHGDSHQVATCAATTARISDKLIVRGPKNLVDRRCPRDRTGLLLVNVPNPELSVWGFHIRDVLPIP